MSLNRKILDERGEALDLRSLARPYAPLDFAMLLADAARHLNTEDAEFAAVERAGKVVGICSRSRIAALFGSRFGYALKARAVLGEHLEPSCLIVREDEPVLSVLQRVFQREENLFGHDVIVLDAHGSYLGLVKAHTMAMMQNHLLSEKVQHLEERQGELELATRRLKRSNEELERARDQSLRAGRAKSDFLAVMSHEIRTPLNGVIGMMTLLGDSKLDSDQRELLRTASDSAEALLLILNDILDFSRIEAGKIELDPQPFDVRELAESVLTLMVESAKESGLEVICDIDVCVPRTFVADGGRVRQILANFLGNAVKFTESGEIRLRVRYHSACEADGRLLFEVEDTGIGISPEAQGRLFKPFAQADSSTTRRYGGTGLGLAICAQLVEAMHGEIGLESELGAGSRFWFSLPCPGLAALEPYEPTRQPVATTALVRVEHREVARVLERELAKRNFVPVLCDSLPRLAAAMRDVRRDIGLIILDSSDWKALRGEQEPQAPTIVLHPTHGNELRDFPLSGQAHLCKPVRPTQLDRCIAAVTFQPAAGATGRAGEPKLDESPVRPAVFQPARVLVVDDNPVNRRLVARLVERMGHVCVNAEDGLEALDLCLGRAFDVILLDCRMPRMDGYEFARRWRIAEAEGEGRRKRVPIVALTANAMQGDQELCFAAGMDAYLTKPIRKPALEQTLRAALRGELANLAFQAHGPELQPQREKV